MLSKEELFDKADQYDFDTIREYLEGGGNIELYDGGGRSLLTALLDAYYRLVYSSCPDEAQFLNEHEDDDEYYRHVNKYSRMPLEDRPHSIKEQIDYLMAKGITPNAVGWKEAAEHQKWDPCVETPLFQSVVNCDYCMTEYLLKNGAEPGQKLSSSGDYDEKGYDDWLLEHLDIYIFNGDRGDAAALDLEIAALLMHCGLDQWSGGFCIDVDKENRSISAHSPHMWY